MAKSNNRLLPFILIAVGLLLVVTAISFALLIPNILDPVDVALPNQVGGLAMVSVTRGSQAIQEISSLHGEEFVLESGAIAVYGKDRQITVWVARTGQAAEMFSAMKNKSAQGNSPFQLTGERQLDGHLIDQLDGMGQTNFYFQSGDRVIWLAANQNLAENALQQIFNFYR